MADIEPSSSVSSLSVSSNSTDQAGESDCSPEPLLKKTRKERDAEGGHCGSSGRDSLENRLMSVLACVVCFDLPNGSIFQCQHGHLMCTGCFNHLLADARLKNEQASCPSCRIEISSKSTSRNLAVERAVSELPTHCNFCREEFPRNQIPSHEGSTCEQRPARCRFWNVGCRWEGMFYQKSSHEQACAFPLKSGVQLVEGVDEFVKSLREDHEQLMSTFKLFSYEKIAISDIQLSPSRTDDYIPKLYYETNRFNAFDQFWVVRAKVLGNETSYQRSLTYQLSFKGKGNFELKYFLIPGPFGDANIQPEVQRYEFREDSKDSEYHPLSLFGAGECNRLLASRTINLRLMMFLVKK